MEQAHRIYVQQQEARGVRNGGGGGGDAKTGRVGTCHACGSKDHFVKVCPLEAQARTLHVGVTEHTPTTAVMADNKTSASAASHCSASASPSVAHANQKRSPIASALMTTAYLHLLLMAHFDCQSASGRALNAHADIEKSNVKQMAIAGEHVNNAEQVDKQGDEPVFFAVPDPHEITAEALR